jgi:hypothetical protein
MISVLKSAGARSNQGPATARCERGFTDRVWLRVRGVAIPRTNFRPRCRAGTVRVMSLASLRYFGVRLLELDASGLRTDAPLGRFVPIADPLPVGTTVELDGVPHRIVRVDEGLTPGVWLWTDGVATAPMPDMVTVRDLPVTPEAVPVAIDAAPTVATAAPEAATPDEVAPTPSEKNDDGTKKRRRRGKTTFGH